MPLYEYKCNTCGEGFEKMVRFSEANLIPTCPKCESQDIQKKISAVASFGISQSAGSMALSGGSCGSSGGFS